MIIIIKKLFSLILRDEFVVFTNLYLITINIEKLSKYSGYFYLVYFFIVFCILYIVIIILDFSLYLLIFTLHRVIYTYIH